MSKDWVADVACFHKHIKYEHHRNIPLKYPDLRIIAERNSFMLEELAEFNKAIKEYAMLEAADALVDLIYFAIGTAHCFGIDLAPFWEEAHRANMEKIAAPARHKNAAKPEHWQPPNLEAAFERMRKF